MNLGERILKYRKEKGLTQNEMAEKLFVSYQAISQWENGITKPDIELLPKIAQLFDISIDDLFNDNSNKEIKLDNNKDDTLYIVIAKGNKVLDLHEFDSLEKVKNQAKEVHVDITGETLNVYSYFRLQINGNINGSITCNEGITCANISGSINAGNDVVCCNVGGSVTAGCDVCCQEVGGSVHAGGDVACQDVAASVVAGGDVTSNDVYGDVTSGCDIQCENIYSENVKADGDIIFNGSISKKIIEEGTDSNS